MIPHTIRKQTAFFNMILAELSEKYRSYGCQIPLARRTSARNFVTSSKNRPFLDEIPGANLSQNSSLNPPQPTGRYSNRLRTARITQKKNGPDRKKIEIEKKICTFACEFFLWILHQIIFRLRPAG